MEPGRAGQRARPNDAYQPRAAVRGAHTDHSKAGPKNIRGRDTRAKSHQQQQLQGMQQPASNHYVNRQQVRHNKSVRQGQQEERQSTTECSSSGTRPGMSCQEVNGTCVAQLANSSQGHILPDPSLAGSLAESFQLAYYHSRKKPIGSSAASSPIPTQQYNLAPSTPQFELTEKSSTAWPPLGYQERVSQPPSSVLQGLAQPSVGQPQQPQQAAPGKIEHPQRQPEVHQPISYIPLTHPAPTAETAESNVPPSSTNSLQPIRPNHKAPQINRGPWAGVAATIPPTVHRRTGSSGSGGSLATAKPDGSRWASSAKHRSSQVNPPEVSSEPPPTADGKIQLVQTPTSLTHAAQPIQTPPPQPAHPPHHPSAPPARDGTDQSQAGNPLHDVRDETPAPARVEPPPETAPSDPATSRKPHTEELALDLPIAVPTDEASLPAESAAPEPPIGAAHLDVEQPEVAPTVLDGDFPPLPGSTGVPNHALSTPTPASPIPLDVQKDALSKLLQTVDVFDHQVPTWVFEEAIPHKGMENKGQICYIISALQSLMDVAPGIYRAIYRAHQLLLEAQDVVVEHGIQAEENGRRRETKDGKVKGVPLLLAHWNMLEAYFDASVHVIAATKMQQIGRAVLKDFQMGQQEDAVEFLCSYLLRLNQELKTLQLAAKKGLLGQLVETEHVVEDTWHVPGKKGKRNSMLEGQQRIQQQHTTIADAVWGITSYAEYKSSKASRCSQLQLYYILMLPLTRTNGTNGSSNGGSKQANGASGMQGSGKNLNGSTGGGAPSKLAATVASSGSLQGLVDSYFAEQSVEDRHQADTVEEAKLGHAPKILMAQLLRFTYTNAYKQVKLNDLIHVSGEIQMPYQHTRVKYKLRSVIMHAGNSVDYGHYYVTLRQQGNPKVLDDQLIGDKPRSSNKGDAYIITYVRCD